MSEEIKALKEERKDKILKNEPYKIHVYFCQRCGKIFEEKVPESEGWQPFSLYPCKNCGEESASFIRYKYFVSIEAGKKLTNKSRVKF